MCPLCGQRDESGPVTTGEMGCNLINASNGAAPHAGMVHLVNVEVWECPVHGPYIYLDEYEPDHGQFPQGQDDLEKAERQWTDDIYSFIARNRRPSSNGEDAISSDDLAAALIKLIEMQD
jgi:hypothetical protein